MKAVVVLCWLFRQVGAGYLRGSVASSLGEAHQNRRLAAQQRKGIPIPGNGPIKCQWIPWKKEVECTGKEGEPDTSKLKPSHKAKAAAAAAPKESESTVSDSASSDGKPTMTLADEPNYDSMPSVSLPFLSLADGAAESTDMAAAPSTSTADETQAEGYLQTGAPALDASITEPETANTESSEAAAAAAGGEAGGSSVLQLTGRVEFAEEQEEVAQVPAPREAAVEEGAGSGDSIAAAPGGAPEAESAGSAESAARSAAPAADETKAAVGSEEVKAEALPEPAEDRPIDGSAVAAMAPIPNTEVTGEASPETLRVDALPSSGASSATALEQPNATPLVVDSSPAALKSSTANRATIAFAIRIALATLTGGALPSPLTTDASSGDVHVQSSTDSSGTTSSSPSTSDKEAAVLALQAGLDVLLAAEQAPKQAAAASEKPPSLIGALLHTQ